MRKIAIFVSGAGESAERIVNLFNEGNRLRTEIVVVSDTGRDLMERLSGTGVTVVHIPDEEWNQREQELEALLKENDIELIVRDNFLMPVGRMLIEAARGKTLEVSGPENAPREVVAELEKEFREPKPQKQEQKEERNPSEPPSLEEEWASSLKINYTPPKVPMDPPPVPREQEEVVVPPIIDNNPPAPPRRQWGNTPDAMYNANREGQERKPEPMPSTYLIWSILVTIFCCFIPGIVAIVYSTMVSNKYYAGDIEGSKKASRMAEIWIIVSVVLGIVIATLYVPLSLI